MKQFALRFALPIAFIFILPYVYPNSFFMKIITSFAALYLVVVGLNLLVGIAGQLSLGQTGFFAIGAYGAALLVMKLQLPFFVSIFVAAGVTALFGAIVAMLSLRSHGPYLAMVTIAFGLLVEIVANRWVDVTGGPAGLFLPKADLFGYALNKVEYFYFAALLALAGQWVATNLTRSQFGRTLHALRNSPVAAESLGVNVTGWKVGAFVLSAFYAGVGGALFAFQDGYINSDSFTFSSSIMFLVAVIVGGAGTVLGPFVGTLIIEVLPTFFANLYDYHLLIFGSILLLTLVFLPEGVVGTLGGRWRKKPPAVPEQIEPYRIEPADMGEIAIRIEGLKKYFGGVKAIDGVTFTVQRGTIHGVIGPNGSGKSTMVNLLSGVYTPSEGQVLLNGNTVQGKPTFRIAKMGMTRTFQNIQLFSDLTVMENVLVGFHRQFRSGMFRQMLALRSVKREEQQFVDQCFRILKLVGLEQRAYEIADSLSYGEKRLMEIARALAMKPSVLLLDEPAAGASPVEVERIVNVIRKLRDAGLTVILIEHHMEIVMEFCDSITVLDFGIKLAEGTPEQISRNEKVVEAYLGGEEVMKLVGGF
ncbi:ABC transporter permease subunit [Effusibacillus lacus]|uniref:ABC transporter n=1 Tax=Effusibacillus lacus TaxID=1348429 RepID=A0A292YI66_9BACL|nr:branched-chain amino acid ABC transporter ATP-binding protein/permease [Effusibacillus lacus]TCS71856.1 amino acid/amide ABC transporter membrane protein 2 (HAAT family) /amino acid/amide ABC transporter ATP-binding protein 1 (HAAT family) [Effusibacillus lacus]GAX89578.1 ABC transporter [Effusibacillus lacus]